MISNSNTHWPQSLLGTAFNCLRLFRVYKHRPSLDPTRWAPFLLQSLTKQRKATAFHLNPELYKLETIKKWLEKLLGVRPGVTARCFLSQLMCLPVAHWKYQEASASSSTKSKIFASLPLRKLHFIFALARLSTLLTSIYSRSDIQELNWTHFSQYQRAVK